MSGWDFTQHLQRLQLMQEKNKMRELQFIKALIKLLTKHGQLHLLEATTLTAEEIQELLKPLKFRDREQIAAALKLSRFLQEVQ